LPGKAKQADKPFFLRHWQPITAITSVVILLSGLGVVANENYIQGQISAAADAEFAVELAQLRIGEVSATLDDLEVAIQNALEISTEAVGQTSDGKDLEALVAEIETAKEIWVKETTRLLELEAAVKALRQKTDLETSSGTAIATLVKSVNDAVSSNWGKIVVQVVSLGEKTTSVQVAQALWEQEQEEVAAEKAEAEAAEEADRLARARTITPTSTLTDTGGSTAPSAPAPPAQEVVVAPVEDGQNLAYITSYIAALAPNSFISWVPGLCDGYYVCGRAWVGGVNSTPVRIELDPALYDIYVNTVGISVLVHEAAHARQWFKYGSNIITANEGYTGLVGTIAVERMADCATIVKLGYSTNVYTSSCTPSELEAAATIW
jgi:phosphopantetheine adenylyltransferase